MTKVVRQPVNVEAKTGNFGINAIKESVGKNDGYTLMVGSIITNSMTPVMHRDKIDFDYDKEMVPIQPSHSARPRTEQGNRADFEF